MGIAPGGLIKQCILEDPYPAESWDSACTIYFNVQIPISELFHCVIGLAPPRSLISAKTYADLGLPFHKLWEEASSIKGNFKEVQSVKSINKAKGAKDKDGSLAQLEKSPRNQHVVLMKHDENTLPFRPVSELERELARKKPVRF